MSEAALPSMPVNDAAADRPVLPWDRSAGLAVAVLTLAAVLFWLPTMKHPTWWIEDNGDRTLAIAGVARASIVEYGQFPFWNPFQWGGLPLLANPQSAFLSPSFLPVLLTGEVVGTKLRILFALWVGLIGAYFLGRRLADGPLAGYVLAAVFLLGSWYPLYMWRGHEEFIAFPYLPWVVLFFHASLNRLRYALLAGACLAWMVLEGGIYPVPYTGLLLALYALCLLVDQRRLAPVWSLAVTGGFAAVIGGIKVLPLMDYMRDNPRAWLMWERPVPLSAVPPFFLHRDQIGGRFFPGSFYGWHEYGCYVGWIAVALAAVGLALALRRSWPWLLLGAAFLALMLGDFGPYSPWRALHKLPVFLSLHDTPRFRVVPVFCIAALAALGVGRLWTLLVCRPRGVLWRGAFAAALTAVVAALFVDLYLVNSRIYGKISAYPPFLVEKAGAFQQVLDESGHNADQSYPIFLQGKGLKDNYEPMAAPHAAVRTANKDPLYRGEVWLAGGGSVVTQRWSPNRLEYQVTTGEATRLVVNQRYERGWRAADGRPVTPMDGLISVAVTPRDGRIVLFYRPRLFVAGCVLTGLGVLAVGLAFLPMCAGARARLSGWFVPVLLGARERVRERLRPCAGLAFWTRHWPRAFDAAVLLLVLIVALMRYNLTVEQYFRFAIPGPEEQAIYNHVMWNISHRLSWEQPILHGTSNYLSNHFSPIYAPLSLVHALWPDPRMLFALNNLALSLAVYILYRLAVDRLKARLAAFGFVLLLLTHAVMADNLMVQGFRDTAPALLFLSVALWAYERQRFAVFVTGLALAAACREDVALLLAGFTIVALAQRRSRRWKLFPVIFAALFSALAFLAMAHLGEHGVGRDAHGYGYLGATVPQALGHAMAHPGLWIEKLLSPAKVRSFLELIGPFGYLAILAPEYLLIPLTQFAALYLTEHTPVATNGYGHVAPVVPFVFYASVAGLARLLKLVEWLIRLAAKRRAPEDDWPWLRRGTAALGGVVAAALLVGALPPPHGVNLAPWSHMKQMVRGLGGFRHWVLVGRPRGDNGTLDDLVAAVPKDARVCAQSPFLPALSARAHIALLPDGFADAEYVVVAPTYNAYPTSSDDYQRILMQLNDGRSFRVAWMRGDIRVYTRRGAEMTIRSAQAGLMGEFYAFKRPLWRFPEPFDAPVALQRVFPAIDFPPSDREFTDREGYRTELSEFFVARFSGFLIIDRPGDYVFRVESDDGFRLWIDGKLAAEFNNVRAFSGTDAPVALGVGAHAIRLDYFNNGKPGGLRLSWVVPGGAGRVVVPPEALRWSAAEGAPPEPNPTKR